MINLIAQTDVGGNFSGLGPLGIFNLSSSVDEPVGLFNKVMSIIVGFLTVVAGIWFIFQFIIGAIGWLTAGGDKNKVQEAQTKITQSILGLAIIIAAIFIIDLIGTLLGLKILSPGSFIKNIWQP